MASADLRAELECPVCLEVYTDPVTLKCGHNFCQDCIVRVLDTQEHYGGYSCPQCRDVFKERPALQKNVTLRNIVENFLPAWPDQEQSGVFCTYCIHTPVPAVKSCLMCEASLCDNHLRVHSKSLEHVFCDPNTSPEDRKCSIHKKILEYYCTEDEICICMYCSLTGEHRGHQVETLVEASEKKKKKLRSILQKLMTEREKTEKRVQSLEERRRKVLGQADDEKARVTTLFRDLRRRLEDLEKRVLREISKRTERTTIYVSDIIGGLEIKKDELSRKMHHIEELCNMMDPLPVLQEADTGDLCDIEDGHDEDTHDDGGGLDVERVSHILHTGFRDIMSRVYKRERPGTDVSPYSSIEDEDFTTAGPSRPRPPPAPTVRHSYNQARGPNIRSVEKTSGVPHTLYTWVHDIMSGLNVQERPGTRVSPYSSIEDEDSTTAGPSRPRPQPTTTVKHSYHQAGGPNIRSVEQTSGVSGVTDILLDVNTAGNNLHISDDRKVATWTRFSQNRPETLERFQGCPQVLSSQKFSSGQYSWEVDVGGAKYWRVGVCYPSIERRGDQALIGHNKKSWCLEWRSDYNLYSVRQDTRQTFLQSIITGNKVRIALDYEAGQISFYIPNQHLHTFTTTFTEPLHAALWVLEGSIKILG